MHLHNVRVLGPTGLSLPTTVEINAAGAADRDASGLILSPGWLDLHAHLRDPGFPQKETLQTGATSAAFGGFTHIVAMANTDPVTDRPELLRALVARAAALPIRVSFVAAVTMGLEGRTLTDAAALQRAGAVALSDDGRHLMSQVILRRALTAAAEAGLPVLMHAQIERLGSGPESEARAVTEALEALEAVPGARLHIQHVSTRAGVELIRTAKQHRLLVTATARDHRTGNRRRVDPDRPPCGVDRGRLLLQESGKKHALFRAAAPRTHRDDPEPRPGRDGTGDAACLSRWSSCWRTDSCSLASAADGPRTRGARASSMTACPASRSAW